MPNKTTMNRENQALRNRLRLIAGDRNRLILRVRELETRWQHAHWPWYRRLYRRLLGHRAPKP